VTLFVGIDPGTSGAIALLDECGRLLSVVPMPGFGTEPAAMDVSALLEAMGRPDELYVILEEPFANNMASAISQLNQGIGYGVLLGVVGTMGLRHERIKPSTWKRTLGLPMSRELTYAQKKRNSRQFATRFWPDQAHNWSKTTQDGLAEAALIAEAGRRRFNVE